MKKLLFILTAGCTMALVSCEEWLDKYPLAQMSPETFFSNENELQAFSNKFYTAFPSDGLYNEYWDNIIHNDLPQEMRGGRTIPASGGGWTWTNLRDINTLLEYSGNCKDTDVRNRYDALARFFRVYFYFERSSGSATCRGTRNRSARPIPNSSVRAIRASTSCSA